MSVRLRWPALLALILALLLPGRAAAHTFTVITADLLVDGDDVSLTIQLSIPDVLVLVKSTLTTLDHAALVALMPELRKRLGEHVELLADGKPVVGTCHGYIPDLLRSKSAPPPDARLPDKLAFLITWTLPAAAAGEPGTNRLDLRVAVFDEIGLSGFVQTTLHRGTKSQPRSAQLGRTATFWLRQEPFAAPVPVTAVDPGPGPVVQVSAAVNQDEQPIATSGLSTWDLLVMGFHHIVPQGLDHILFVVSLYLLAPRLKPLLIQVTAFTLAHSATLGLAMVGWVLLPSRLVETLIALSIVVCALENVWWKEVKPWRWMLVFAFGLVHGLGFAGSFSQLQLSPGDILRPLLCLNVGVELGQITVVAGCAVLTWWFREKTWYRTAITVPASLTIAAIGLWWSVQRAFGL